MYWKWDEEETSGAARRLEEETAAADAYEIPACCYDPVIPCSNWDWCPSSSSCCMDPAATDCQEDCFPPANHLGVAYCCLTMSCSEE